MTGETIVTMVKKLIDKMFYKTKEEAMEKCDVYFAMNRITEEQYADLALYAEQEYSDVVVNEEHVDATETE